MTQRFYFILNALSFGLSYGQPSHFPSSGGNYIGVSMPTTGDELWWDHANAYCQTNFQTQLATVLTADDNTEIVAILDEFPTKTKNVWIGWRDNENIDVWLPCNNINCESNSYACSANNELLAGWHESEGSFDKNKCGVIHAYGATTGKWYDLGCTAKRDFVCNAKNGKYGNGVPFNCGAPTTKAPTTKAPTTKAPTTKAPIITPTPAPVFSVCNSNLGLDIAFLIDESGSITPDGFNVIKAFIQRLVQYDINDKSYVSLIEYADSHQQILPFTSVSSGRQNIIDSVNTNQQSGGQTNTGSAISYTLQLFDINNERPDLLFVLTDGEPTDTVCPLGINIGDIDIVLIGIGSGLSEDKLLSATFNCLYDTSINNVYYVPNFDEDEFNAKEQALRAKTCRESAFPTIAPVPQQCIGFGGIVSAGKYCFRSDCPQIGGSGCSADCCHGVVGSGPYCDEITPPLKSCRFRQTPDPDCNNGYGTLKWDNYCFRSNCPQFGGSGCNADCCGGVIQSGPTCQENGPPLVSCYMGSTETANAINPINDEFYNYGLDVVSNKNEWDYDKWLFYLWIACITLVFNVCAYGLVYIFCIKPKVKSGSHQYKYVNNKQPQVIDEYNS